MRAMIAIVIGLGLAGCADERARCGAEPCHGPAGLPCRCGASLPTAGDAASQTSSGMAHAGGSPGAAGAGGGEATPADIEIVGTTQNQGSVVEVKVHEVIDLTLQTIGPGEYGDPQLSSTAVLFDGKDDAPLANPAGPRQIYRFHAEASGTATLTIPHTADQTAFTLTFHVS